MLFSDIAAFGHANLVKLSDFGIAHFVGGSRLTNTEAISGTATYLSPEQALGDTVSTETDIYSARPRAARGVTGRREFDGGLVESAIARLHRDPGDPARAAGRLAPAAAVDDGPQAGRTDRAAHEVAASLREIWSESRVRRVRRVRARLGLVDDRASIRGSHCCSPAPRPLPGSPSASPSASSPSDPDRAHYQPFARNRGSRDPAGVPSHQRSIPSSERAP